MAMAHHVHDAVLKALDLVAQHLCLALLQTHRTMALRVRQLHCGQKRGMALKEIRRVHQIIGNIVFGDGAHGLGGDHLEAPEIQKVKVSQARQCCPQKRM